jgi:hypothetical protein
MDAQKFDPQGWLLEDVGEGQPRHDRLCFLLVANNGFRVHGWGVLSWRDGGHQCGLEQNDAIELMRYESFIDGLHAGGVDVLTPFDPYYKKYLERFKIVPDNQEAANDQG